MQHYVPWAMRETLRESLITLASTVLRRVTLPLVDQRLGELSRETSELRIEVGRAEQRIAELTESVSGLVAQLRETDK